MNALGNLERPLRAALLALVAGACGASAPSAPVARPAPSRPPAAALPAAPAECRIEVSRADGLSVAPPGGDPFPVAISDGLLALTPTADERRLSARVEHPLRFRAEAPLADQRLVLIEEADFAAGAVHAAAGTAIVAMTAGERGLEAHLALGARSPLDPHGVVIVVGPVEADCAQVGPRAAQSETVSLPRRVSGGELRIASALPLVLRPVRSAPASVELRPREASGFVPVWMLDRQGEHARIALELSDGSRVAGWVPLSALREASAEETEIVERAVAREPSAIGLSVLGEMGGGGGDPLPVEGYVGPASLRPSSAIAAGPGEAPWAHSAEAPLEVEVRWLRGARHVELLEIPGMWIPSGHAWVERADVAIPAP